MEVVDSSTIPPLIPLYTDIASGHPGTPDAAVHHTDRCDGNPTIYIDARPGLGLLPLCCKEDIYAFNNTLHLHAK